MFICMYANMHTHTHLGHHFICTPSRQCWRWHYLAKALNYQGETGSWELTPCRPPCSWAGTVRNRHSERPKWQDYLQTHVWACECGRSIGEIYKYVQYLINLRWRRWADISAHTQTNIHTYICSIYVHMYVYVLCGSLQRSFNWVNSHSYQLWWLLIMGLRVHW